MVVIDAEKHHLDYKQSEKDNNIQALRQKYQIKVDENGKIKYGGASTLISRAKGQVDVDKRQGTPKPNLLGKEWYDPNRPEGALIYKKADDATYTVKKVDKKTGEVTHFLKLGSGKERLEREKLEEENKLLRAKTKALEESAESKVMYEEVLRAMRDYSGAGDPDEY